mmetsp:Transcript_21033/g.58612  ORF Transcript_21033/g.58612 Transcript_21033/m.58612 type:complete len:218 (+) Transcript_21033:1381-2034(+)
MWSMERGRPSRSFKRPCWTWLHTVFSSPCKAEAKSFSADVTTRGCEEGPLNAETSWHPKAHAPAQRTFVISFSSQVFEPLRATPLAAPPALPHTRATSSGSAYPRRVMASTRFAKVWGERASGGAFCSSPCSHVRHKRPTSRNKASSSSPSFDRPNTKPVSSPAFQLRIDDVACPHTWTTKPAHSWINFLSRTNSSATLLLLTAAITNIKFCMSKEL